MKRRWIIRVLFMLPILLCLSGWGWSGTHKGSLFYIHERNECGFSTSEGVVRLEIYMDRTFLSPETRWESYSSQQRANYFFPSDPPSYLGFYIDHTEWAWGNEYSLAIPCWFLILIFSVVLFLVWRKNRPELNPKTSFPVESEQHD